MNVDPEDISKYQKELDLLGKYYTNVIIGNFKVKRLILISDDGTIHGSGIMEIYDSEFCKNVDNGILMCPSFMIWKDYTKFNSFETYWIRSQPFNLRARILTDKGYEKLVNFEANIQIGISNINERLESETEIIDNIEGIAVYSEDYKKDKKREWKEIPNNHLNSSGLITKSVRN